MYENSIGDGVVASDMHVGQEMDPNDPCPPGSPAGRPVSFGARIVGVAAGATGTTTFTVSRRTKIKCASLPPAQAPNFTVIRFAVGDVENIVAGGAAQTGSGALGPLGVSGTEFLPYGTCCNAVSGQCMDLGEPLIIAYTNNSGVAASLEWSICGNTVNRPR